jgi:arabinosaccharide transport system substrate-binding protein
MFLTKAFLKKGVILPLILIILLLALAACGGAATPAPAAPTEAKPAEQPAAAKTEEPTKAAEAPAAEAQEVPLTFWTFVDAHADFFNRRAEAFNAAHPEVKIKLEPTVIDYNEMHDKLLIALQSGTGAPDLVDIEIAKFGTFLRGDIQLHDLTPLVERSGKDLLKTRLAPYQLNGKQYGVDYHLGAVLMYYNKELMDKAGVDIDSIKTWDDYRAAGKQVMEKTGAVMATVETTDKWSLSPLMQQNGGGVYDKDGNFILDSQANVEALQLLSDMFHKDKILSIAPGGFHHSPDYYAMMNAGDKVASVWMPQWYMLRFKDFMPDLKGKMVARPLPAFKEGGMISTMGGGTGTAITKQIDPAKLDVAMQFLEFAKLAKEAQIQIWTDPHLGFDPYRLDVYDDPELKKPDPYFSNEPVMQTVKDMLDRLAPEYNGPRYPEAQQQIREKIAYGLFEENKAPADLLKASADEINAMQ